MFTTLGGEIQFTFRSRTTTVQAESTLNIPAIAPHFFRNVGLRGANVVHVHTGAAGRVFPADGQSVDSFDADQPHFTDAGKDERQHRATELAPRVQDEILV